MHSLEPTAAEAFPHTAFDAENPETSLSLRQEAKAILVTLDRLKHSNKVFAEVQATTVDEDAAAEIWGDDEAPTRSELIQLMAIYVYLISVIDEVGV